MSLIALGSHSDRSDLVDSLTLSLPKVFPFVDFETMSWTQTGNPPFSKQRLPWFVVAVPLDYRSCKDG